ncbi:ATP-binding protein [Emcibacter sp. SYSU 3D8]|uniref:Dph6-related ATP pyrophosphatase n=1 Tax=Emcibacter sp. SYSU 3D8 TaxID=3133969 RepID=UPI0031FF1288
MRPKVCVSWSSGKDSAFALWEARRDGVLDVASVLTTVNVAHGRVAMHGVRDALLDRQVAALGLPCLKVSIPSPCPNHIYEARMREATARLIRDGITQMVFGDLFLEDIRAYREDRLREAGMTGIYPLWGRDTLALANEMIDSGLVAYLTCVDPRRLDRSFAGRRFDAALLADLPDSVDPCGENGEFHTVVTGGPMFSAPIPVSIGEVVERDGFVFADVIPA